MVQQTINKTSATPAARDRKCNIILYGLQECPKGTIRSVRTKQEVEKVMEIFASIDKDVGPQSIRDCFRLGKYKEPNSRPRPVLVKMNRSIDVINLLAVHRNPPDHLTIKPDLSPEERELDSILMKVRWELIQSGQNKKDIKIQSTKLYLKGNLYGSVTDSKFVLCAHSANIQIRNQSHTGTVASSNEQNQQTTSYVPVSHSSAMDISFNN